MNYLQDQGYEVTITKTDYREPYDDLHFYDTYFEIKNTSISWTMGLFIQDEKAVEYELDIYLP